MRDPLIVLVGETALEVRLDLHRAALHVPRPVVLLRPHEEGGATLEGRILGRHAKLPKRVQHLTGRIRVAVEVRRLRPSAVATLEGT